MATVEERQPVVTHQRPSIMQLALPAILGNLLYGIVGLVQTKVVGQLGAEALAAVGAGQRVFFALQAVMMAIGAGTTALVARAWGRNDEVEAGRITIASLVLGGVFGLVLTIPGVFYSEPRRVDIRSGRTHGRTRGIEHPLAIGLQRGVRRELHHGRRAACGRVTRGRRCMSVRS